MQSAGLVAAMAASAADKREHRERERIRALQAQAQQGAAGAAGVAGDAHAHGDAASDDDPDDDPEPDGSTWINLYWSRQPWYDRMCLACFNNALTITAFLQVWLVMIALAIDPDALVTTSAPDAGFAGALLVLAALQLFVIITAHVAMARELRALYVRPLKIWNMYLSTVISFAMIYFVFFCLNRASFSVSGYSPTASSDTDANPDNDADQDTQDYNDVATVYLFFLYFSGVIMTSTGFGDISPSIWYAQVLTNGQMLLGTMYHVAVFGLTLAHFRALEKLSAEEKAERAAAKLRKQEEQRAAGQSDSLQQVMDFVDSLDLSRRIRSVHPLADRLAHLCLRHLALASISFQILITLLLFIVPDPFEPLSEKEGSEYTLKLVIVVLMVLLQTLLFITVIVISLGLVRSVDNHDLSANFLVQSYISTALLFGGIYFILFVSTPHHQFYRSADFSTSIYETLYMFMHFSLVAMTTTGFGDIYARGVIARMFVLMQMLISVLYNAVIIGLGTSVLTDLQSQRADAEFERLKKLQAEQLAHKLEQEIDEELQSEEEEDEDEAVEA